MPLDTRNWPEGFGSNSVCKKIRLGLTESQLSMDTCPVMEFLQQYSSIFLQVEIECMKCKEMRLIKSWCRHFIIFLQILTSNSQLILDKFSNFSKYFKHIEDLRK
ncbi:hypothetical protein AVEN_89046-1 [Araneus ventricosus]|uniref:Uncharacterized protein n=1 Tax=Araneus ventricosus TaxID=182803 RepID=A0A4Y2B0X3_ARAVE|nr:hypothetical protein AVEN_89046-1 [Araneus ventricosus]